MILLFDWTQVYADEWNQNQSMNCHRICGSARSCCSTHSGRWPLISFDNSTKEKTKCTPISFYRTKTAELSHIISFREMCFEYSQLGELKSNIACTTCWTCVTSPLRIICKPTFLEYKLRMQFKTHKKRYAISEWKHAISDIRLESLH